VIDLEIVRELGKVIEMMLEIVKVLGKVIEMMLGTDLLWELVTGTRLAIV
jgi:hypothetical protein